MLRTVTAGKLNFSSIISCLFSCVYKHLNIVFSPHLFYSSSVIISHRTPLHCAASCNNVQVCKFLVESGAAVFAMTYSDMQTAADKCEEMEEGYTQCSQFLYGEWDQGSGIKICS